MNVTSAFSFTVCMTNVISTIWLLPKKITFVHREQMLVCKQEQYSPTWHSFNKQKLVVGGYECASFNTLLFRITQNILMNQFKLKGCTTLLDKLTDKSIGLKLTQLATAMVL